MVACAPQNFRMYIRKAKNKNSNKAILMVVIPKIFGLGLPMRINLKFRALPISRKRHTGAIVVEEVE